MPAHLILSIGTSIIGRYNSSVAQNQKLEVDYPPGWSYQPVYNDETFPVPKLIGSLSYKQVVPFLREPARHGAEQSTFAKLEASGLLPNRADCQYHLIATDTADGIFCAYFLGHEVFPPEQVKYYIPQGLGAADNKQFASRGLPGLLSCIAAILDQAEEQEEQAIIIPTGGYKILTPYLTIASILYKRPAFYLYEESRQAIELPAPPLSVNTSEFRSAVVLLENIIGVTRHNADTYYQALPKSFQTLVYTDERGIFHYTAFGERLKQMFNWASRSPLVIRSSENTLIRHLGPYQDRFLEMTRLGDTVWLGDKAPEMADHARYHHLDLFAYAELVLLPILTARPDFLSAAEVFLLLGIMYLHDCGHSMSSFPTDREVIPLLPTEIRNYHNLLGYLRLKDAAFLHALQRQELKLLDKATLENIAALAVYHRKKMLLLQGTYYGPDNTLFPALIEQSVIQDGQTIPGDRLTLLVALFRIIDGMDKQLERAGDAVEISMKAEAILADLPHLWQRVVRLKDMLSSWLPEAQQAADALLYTILADYKLTETVSSKPKDAPEHFAYTELQEALNHIGCAQYLPLVWEYLDARVRFFFQALQPSYYYSDLLLKMPRVTYCEDPSTGIGQVTITYTQNEDVQSAARIERIWEQIRNWVEQYVPHDAPERNIVKARLATPAKIVEGIREENNPDVQQIFRDHQLRIEIPPLEA